MDAKIFMCLLLVLLVFLPSTQPSFHRHLHATSGFAAWRQTHPHSPLRTPPCCASFANTDVAMTLRLNGGKGRELLEESAPEEINPLNDCHHHPESELSSSSLSQVKAAALCDTTGKLMAARMNLTSIDASVGDVEGLVRADVSYNKLHELGGIRRIDTLTWLQASNNKIVSARTLAGMASLRVLNLGHNELESFEGIGACRQLQALMANDNAISSLDALAQLSRLTSLVLSGNQISGFQASLFESMPHLSKLSLSRNRLTAFPPPPPSLPLRELRLAYNMLTDVPTLPSSLVILDLGHNRLSTADALASLSALVHLRNLNLAGNPIAGSADYRSMILSLCPALKTLDGRPVDSVNAVFAAPSPKTPDPREIFISNLPWGAGEQHLRRLCASLGPRAVRRIQLLKQASRGGRSKGAAFVKLRDAAMAKEACVSLGNRTVAAEARDGSIMVRKVRVRASWRDRHGKPIQGQEDEEEKTWNEGGEATSATEQDEDVGAGHDTEERNSSPAICSDAGASDRDWNRALDMQDQQERRESLTGLGGHLNVDDQDSGQTSADSANSPASMQTAPQPIFSVEDVKNETPSRLRKDKVRDKSQKKRKRSKSDGRDEWDKSWASNFKNLLDCGKVSLGGGI